MQSRVSEISPVLVKVDVEIPWEVVRKSLDDHLAKLARSARIRGFRPGKAPRHVIRQIYGRQLRGEVTAELVEQGLTAAVKEHALRVVAEPKVKPEAIEEGKDLTFSAECEVQPTIEHVNTDGLVLYRGDVEVSDAEVDAAIKRLQREHSQLRTPEPPRPAKAGDSLRISYRLEMAGEQSQAEHDQEAAQERSVELGDGRLLDEVEAGLIGMQRGEQKLIAVTFKAESEGEAAKQGTFDVTVHEVQEIVLPELDDDFAKDCGDYETLLELRLKLRKDLEAQKAEQAKARLKDQAIDRLIAQNRVPVPPSLLEQEKMQMLYEVQSLLQLGPGAASALSQPGLLDGMSERAERRVRAGMLLGALARCESIEVTEADIEAQMHKLAEQSGKHIAKVRAEFQGAGRLDLENRLLEGKLVDWLLERAELRDGEAPAPLADSAEGAESPAQAAR